MQAVGRLGSYISQGVYTVSGPFHPFGGAVDIVVVQQQDGSFKSSPWYVRFGKFQGVLKSKEKIVQINVNDVEADFQMYLDNKGEAFFLREVDADEAVLIDPLESVDDIDHQSLRTKSCNFDSEDGKIVGRTSSKRSRILGLMFGRRSVSGEFEDGVGNKERAEIAANLLDIKWSTNQDGDHAVVVETEDGSIGVVKDQKQQLSVEEVSVVEGVEEGSKVKKIVCCSSEQTHEVMYLAHGETGEVHVHDQVLHSLVSQGTETKGITKNADVVEVFEFHSQVQQIDSEPSMYNVEDVEDLTTSPKSQTNNLDIGHCSSDKAESYCVTNASSYNSQDDRELCDNNTKDKDVSSTLSTPPHSLGDCLPSETSRRSPSSSSDEENFLFSDLDENRMNDRYEGSLTPEYIDKEDNISYENGTENSRVTSCPIVIPRNEDAAGEVGSNVEKFGKYKSAGDQLTRKTMSEDHREMLTALLDNIYSNWLDKVSSARGKERTDIENFINEGVYQVDRLKEEGFITSILYDDEVITKLKERLQVKTDKKLPVVDFRKYSGVRKWTVGISGGKDLIAVIRASGTIRRTEGPFSAPSKGVIGEKFIEKIRRVRESNKFKAAIIRIDSPGGDALASDLMWREIRLLAAKKPVIASMSDVAASGGYYMAMGAGAIVAESLTLTGSIGVVTGKFSLGKLYEKIGFNIEIISRGKYAELLAAEQRSFRPHEAELFAKSAQNFYKQFRDKAAFSRSMTVDKMEEVAQGRVWTGKDAASHGLVDAIGGISRAIAIAKLKANIPQDRQVTVVELSRPRPSLPEILSGLGNSLVGVDETLKELLEDLTFSDGVQARMDGIMFQKLEGNPSANPILALMKDYLSSTT